MENTVNNIYEEFKGLTWPDGTELPEDKFNKTRLRDILTSLQSLSNISEVNESSVRCESAFPFFGWGAKARRPNSITRHIKSDYLFTHNSTYLLIENKIIRDGKLEECNIKNALVQVIEYLNVYDVSGAILLVFDDGRAKERDWRSGQEEKLINCLTSAYPFCVVRVRRAKDTCIYYKNAAQPVATPDRSPLACSG
jgi:hypothetical protein